MRGKFSVRLKMTQWWFRLSRVWRSNKLARSSPFRAPTRPKIVHRRFAGNANQNYLIKFEINMHYKPLERVRYNWIVRTSLQLDFCCHLMEKWWNILASGVVASKGLLCFKNCIIFNTASPFDCFDCLPTLTCWEEVNVWTLISLIR